MSEKRIAPLGDLQVYFNALDKETAARVLSQLNILDKVVDDSSVKLSHDIEHQRKDRRSAGKKRESRSKKTSSDPN